MSNVNFQRFCGGQCIGKLDCSQKLYDEGDPTLPMVGREYTCLFH